MSQGDSTLAILDHSPSAVRDHAHTRRWRVSDAATVITTFVVLGMAGTLFLSRNRGAGVGMFTVEHVTFLGMVDTSSQRLAHRVGILLLVGLCVLGSALVTR